MAQWPLLRFLNNLWACKLKILKNKMWIESRGGHFWKSMLNYIPYCHFDNNEHDLTAWNIIDVNKAIFAGVIRAISNFWWIQDKRANSKWQRYANITHQWSDCCGCCSLLGRKPSGWHQRRCSHGNRCGKIIEKLASVDQPNNGMNKIDLKVRANCPKANQLTSNPGLAYI